MRYNVLLVFLCLILGVRAAHSQCSTSAAATNISCAGLADGSIDLEVASGTAPFTFAWSNNETTEDLSGLAAGTYTCTVTDATACTSSVVATVVEPDPLAVTVQGGTLTCVLTQVTVHPTVTGGTAPFSYLWNGGATSLDTVVSQAGSYLVTVTDTRGCTATAQTVVNQDQALPSCSILPPDVLNCNTPTTTIEASCGGGSNFAYQWATTGGHIAGATNLSVAVVDAPGMYTLTATNSVNGCTAESNIIVVQDIVAPICNAGPDKFLTCFNLQVTLDASGSSTGPVYIYSWIGPGIVSGANTLSPTVNQPGTYTLIVTNTANGCTSTDVVNVSFLGAIPTASAGPDLGIPCGGGTVTLAASGSSGPQITYLWVGPGINISNQSVLNPVISVPGTYLLLITDTQNGCTATSSMTVFPGPVIPTQQISVTNVSCFGGSDGAIDLSFNQGTPPYVYQWSNNATTEDISNLTAGIYTVTVDDASTCNYYAQVTIIQNPQIFLAFTKNNVSCNGGSNGSINLIVSNGTSPFTYQWSNGQTIEDLSGLVAGTYTCTVTDATGCSRTASTSLTQPTAINLSANTVNVQCNGTATGIIDLSISGGTQPYSYDWSNDGPDPVDNDPQDWLNILAGTYTVTVTSASGCTNTLSVTLTQPAALTLNTAIVQPNCLSADGSIDLTMGGGVAPYNYNWSNGLHTQDLANLTAGTYDLTVVDANFCTQTLAVNLSDQGINASANIVDVTCFGQVNGSIDLTVTGGAAPLIYDWAGPGFTSSQEDLANLAPGAYVVTVTSATGCVVIGGPFVVTQPQAMTISPTGMMHCAGMNDGETDVLATGGTPPYSYLWSNGATSQQLAGLSAGTYTVVVTDVFGCSAGPGFIILTEPAPLALTINALSNNCTSNVAAPQVSGGTGAYHFAWSNGATDSLAQFFVSGDYTLSVTDANGCEVTAVYPVQLLSGNCSLIKGRVFQDTMANCLEDTEPALSGWILRAEGPSGVFYGVTNAQGDYAIDVVPGDYSVFLSLPNALWLPCWSSLPVGNVQMDDTLSGFDFPVKPDFGCPMLWVDLSSSNLRRCFSNNTYQVKYCNNGTKRAENAYVLLDLDDFLTPLNANLPYTNLGNGVLRFEVGDLEVGECGWFHLFFKVNCDAALSQTHCTEAHIYPDQNCLPVNPLWSGASLRLSSTCQSDSLRFTIENAGSGNMTNTSNYIVIEDQVMLMSAPVLLDAGESVTVSVPANGSTWRMELVQVPYHPGHSAPALSIEGCTAGSSFSTGFVTQFPADDADEFIDIDCKQNTASSDPNDKQAFPVGYGSKHYIFPGTPLDYTVRFQNTGNDTAFTVRIVDTLSVFLDPTSIRPGASSHPYTWDLSGSGVLSFLFENILLPDSNVNEAASHGFVKFSIQPRPDVPLESVIENTAEIYFDFNDAVITNTTFHRVGDHFITIGLWQPQQPKYKVSVTPNPFAETALLEVSGLKRVGGLRLQMFDLQGVLQASMESESNQFQVKKGTMPEGVYLFKIEQGGKNIGTGKLVIQH